MLRAVKRRLARLCWRASFWLSGVKPTLLVGPEEVALHERRGLERLAKAIGVRLTEEATPDEDRVLRRVFRRAVGKILSGAPTAEDLESQFRKQP